MFFDFVNQVEAVAVLQDHVEQDHVGRVAGQIFLQRRAAVGLGHVALIFQHRRDQVPQILLVVHDQNFGFHVMRFCLQTSINREKIARCSA